LGDALTSRPTDGICDPRKTKEPLVPRRLAAVVLPLALALLVLPSLAAASPARVAWFYKPPTDGSTPAAVASATTGQMILTKRDETFRDQVRASGYAGSILQYVEAAYAHGPIGASSAGQPCDAGFVPWGNNVAWDQGDFCRYLHANESWFLHNGKGERLINGYYTGSHGVFYAMNPASAGWRQFYAGRVRQALFGDATTPALGYDGLFLDDVWMTRHQLLNRVSNADGVVREFGSDSDFRTAVAELLATVRSAAAGRPVYANTDGNDFYLPYLDGTMREDFAASWNGAYMSADGIESTWASADRATAAGKGLVLVGQGAREDRERMRFAYAAYLMVAGPAVSFRYTRDSAAYRELWKFPEYGVDIGSPSGARSLVAGSTWRRQFASGVAVVNLSATASQAVDLGGLHVAADGTLHSLLVLPPKTGAVLRRTETAPAPQIANVAPPVVTGAAVRGGLLSTTNGSWSVAPTSIAYAWLRCTSAGSSCNLIGKATGPTYSPVRGDVGSTIRARVSAGAAGASASAISAAVAVVGSKRSR
jgi:hypothetical protein